jgi:hypothetical protein
MQYHPKATGNRFELRAARVSAACVILYQLLLIALIFIRPELDPSWHTISEWAIGRHGWIMVAAFQISALAYGSLFVAIRRHVVGAAGKVGLVLLGLCAIGTVGVGVFETDPMPFSALGGLSITGSLHILFGGIAMLCLPFAALCINVSLAYRNPSWRSARTALLALAALPLAGMLGFMTHLVVVVAPMGRDAYGPGVPLGWPPRFLFLTYGLWVLAMSDRTTTQGPAR